MDNRSFRNLTLEESQQVQTSVIIPLTREKQEHVKKMILEALIDPREKFKTVTMDDIEQDWKNKQGC